MACPRVSMGEGWTLKTTACHGTDPVSLARPTANQPRRLRSLSLPISSKGDGFISFVPYHTVTE